MTILPSIRVNKIDICTSGTSLMGYLPSTFEHLMKRFGPPLEGSDDGKTTAEWDLEFEDGTVATIYDWKTGSTPEKLYNWHIGGHNQDVLKHIEKATGATVTAF